MRSHTFFSVVSELRKGLEDGTVILPRKDPLADVLNRIKELEALEESLKLPPSDWGEFQCDEDYLRRLGAQDPATEIHFVSYFSERLKATLRARGVDTKRSDDITQETIYRVWRSVHSASFINPRDFVLFVLAVC